MIGHTKATAGIAGLIKAALALHHRVLPPHGGVDKPNPILTAPTSPLYLLDQPMPWLEPGDVPRRAAISAFGFGGTNFHVVMEEYRGEFREGRARDRDASAGPPSCCSGARPTTRARRRLAGAAGATAPHARRGAARPGRQPGRAAGSPDVETVAIVAKDGADLRVKLDLALARLRGDAQALAARRAITASAPRRPASSPLLFPGQGSQYTGMLRELALHFPVCAETLSEADARAARAVRRSASARRHGSAASSSRAAPTARTTRPARGRR